MANKYWIGNGGNWDDTAHWSSSSGGGGGTPVPTSSDDVFFDANSFSLGSQIVHVNLFPASCFSLNFTGVLNIPTFVIDANKELNISRDITLSPNMIFGDSNGTLLFLGPSIITSNGVIFNISVFYLWSGLYNTGIDLADDLNITGEFTLYGAGIFSTNNFNVTARTFTYGAFDDNYVTVNMGSGIWTLNPQSGDTAWSDTNVKSQILNPDTSTLIINVPSTPASNIYFRNLGTTIILNDVIIDGGANSGSFVFYDPQTPTFNSLTIQSAPVTILFYGDTTYNFDTFVANGSDGNLITLDLYNSGITGIAQINSNTTSISYVDVANNTALGNIPFFDYPGGVDSDNNTNWVFTGSSESPSISPSISPSSSVSPSPTPSPGSNLASQNVFLTFADTDGDVQMYNVGNSDYGTSIYYELETQELDFDNRVINKRLSDKFVVFSKDASGSKIQIKQDEKDYKDINIDLGKRISDTTLPEIEAKAITLKWSGNVTNKRPELEGFYFNKVEDKGII